MDSFVNFALSYPQIVATAARDYFGGEYCTTELRATCSALRAIIPAPHHCTIDQLIERAIKTSRADLIHLALSRAPPTYKIPDAIAALALTPNTPPAIRELAREHCNDFAGCALLAADSQLFESLISRDEYLESTRAQYYITCALQSGDIMIIQSIFTYVIADEMCFSECATCKDPRTLTTALSTISGRYDVAGCVMEAFNAAIEHDNSAACELVAKWCQVYNPQLRVGDDSNMVFVRHVASELDLDRCAKYPITRELIKSRAVANSEHARITADAIVLLACWFPQVARADTIDLCARIAPHRPNNARIIARLAAECLDAHIIFERADLTQELRDPTSAHHIFAELACLNNYCEWPDIRAWPNIRELAVDPLALMYDRDATHNVIHIAAMIHFARNPIVAPDFLRLVLDNSRIEDDKHDDIRDCVRYWIDQYPALYPTTASHS